MVARAIEENRNTMNPLAAASGASTQNTTVVMTALNG
jgi:hypothetical protein